MGKKGDTIKKSKKGDSSRKTKYDSSINIGDDNELNGTVIGHNIKIIHKPSDNSVTYEIDKDDVGVLKMFAPYLIGRFGKKRIVLVGAASFIPGLFGFFTGINSMTQNVKVFSYIPTVPYAYATQLFFLSIVFLIFGAIMMAVVQYHTSSQCNKCNKEYAYAEVGTQTVKEVETSEGTRKITTRTYKCRFCGDVDVRKDSELVESQ